MQKIYYNTAPINTDDPFAVKSQPKKY